jgi:aspartate aminotransferase
MFASIEAADKDPIFSLVEEFNQDPAKNKVNLSVGVYQNNEGHTATFAAVTEAENHLQQTPLSKSYLPILGDAEFRQLATHQLLKNTSAVESGQLQSVQAPGGTAAIYLAAECIHKFSPNSKVWVSNPTWGNHKNIFAKAKLSTEDYPYWDANTLTLDFDNMLKTLREKTNPQDVVLFHVCCHNPTGIDPSPAQWETLATLCKEKSLLVIFDCAYQGFSKSFDEDIAPVKLFIDHDIPFFLASSFSKNFGLYCERTAMLSVFTHSKTATDNTLSQLTHIIRGTYSTPPAHGAHIVRTILADSDLTRLWETELTEMRNHLNTLRSKLIDTLKSDNINWDFLKSQSGMFSYTGITPPQVKRLKEEFKIYLLKSGRINIAGINLNNLDYVAKAIAEVVR